MGDAYWYSTDPYFILASERTPLCRVDVIFSQPGVFSEDRLRRHAGTELAQDHFHGHTRATNDRFAVHDGRIDFYACVRHGRDLETISSCLNISDRPGLSATTSRRADGGLRLRQTHPTATASPLRLGERAEDPRPGADALVKTFQVILLVRRMDVVVVEPKPYQHGVEAEGALEIGDDRDRGAGTHQHGFLAPLLGQRAARGGERLHVPVERDRRRAGMIAELGGAVAGQPRGDVIAK